MSQHRRGMTLIEMMVALVVFSIVLAGALRFVLGESRGLRRGGEETAMAQNLRFGADLVREQLRLAGSNVPARQPVLVYAGPNAVAFNADYAANDADNLFAVYVDPDAPDEEVMALPAARKIPIPGSVPAFTYPAADFEPGMQGFAETITFYFAPDGETPRTDDFVLWRAVNDQSGEVVIRNALRTSGLPFFRYFRLDAPQGGARTLQPVAASAIPLEHTAPVHGSAADVGASRDIDSLRAVELSYTVTNGYTDGRERRREITVLIPLPNMGLANLQSCGEEPVFGQALVAVVNPAGGTPVVELSWGAATDESGGEWDIMRYVVWRREAGTTEWGVPYVSIPSGATPPYSYTDPAVTSATTYEYTVAAQDCTPSLSPRSNVASVTIP